MDTFTFETNRAGTHLFATPLDAATGSTQWSRGIPSWGTGVGWEISPARAVRSLFERLSSMRLRAAVFVPKWSSSRHGF